MKKSLTAILLLTALLSSIGCKEQSKLEPISGDDKNLLRLHTLGKLLQAYATDHDDKLPDSLFELETVLASEYPKLAEETAYIDPKSGIKYDNLYFGADKRIRQLDSSFIIASWPNRGCRAILRGNFSACIVEQQKFEAMKKSDEQLLGE